MTRHRRVMWLASAWLLGLCSACSGWGSRAKAPDPLPAPSQPSVVKPLWRLALGAPSGLGFAPVALGGSVWAASQDGTVVRVQRDQGRIEWRVNVGKPLSAGVATDGVTTVVVARDGTVLALDEHGALRWAVPLGTEVVSLPALGDGLVLLRSSENRLFALEVATGRRRWVQSRPNPPLVLRQAGGVAMVPGTAFVGMPGGRLLALALANGVASWDVPVAQPRGATEIERLADLVGSPLVLDDQVCAVAYQGRIGCYDADSGRVRWSRPFSSAVGFDMDAQGLVAPDADDTVQAWTLTGEPAWRQNGLARRVLSAPLIVGTRVVLGDAQGHALWLSRQDGGLLAISPTDGHPIVATPAVAGDVVVVQTKAGGLYAMQVQP